MRRFFQHRSPPIFLCHGCFDLLHVGHLAHLLEVRAEASKVKGLVYVSVTADRFINKGPGRPIMPESERRALVASLKWVDGTFIAEGPTAVESINKAKPWRYCKGADRKFQPNVGPDLMAEIAAVRSHGGDILYTMSPLVHSTDYLERYRNAFNTGNIGHHGAVV